VLAGHQIVDYHGVPGRRISAGPDESRQLRRNAYRHHPAGGAEGTRLFAQRKKIAQGHQRYNNEIQ